MGLLWYCFGIVDCCCGIPVMGLLWWDCCRGIAVVGLLWWDCCDGIAVVGLLWDCCGIALGLL